MPATAVIAAHCDGYCGRTSATMRTARSRSSSGYLLTRPITQILPRSEVSGNAGTGQSALISFTAALQTHQEQTINAAKKTFGRKSLQVAAVEQLFKDLRT